MFCCCFLFFPAWLSHSARLASAISEWRCSRFFRNYLPLITLLPLLYRELNKDCYCCYNKVVQDTRSKVTPQKQSHSAVRNNTRTQSQAQLLNGQ